MILLRLVVVGLLLVSSAASLADEPSPSETASVELARYSEPMLPDAPQVAKTPTQMASVSSGASQGSCPNIQRALDVIQRIDYLPFGYIYNGCHSRALYMNMELTADGLVANSQFTFGTLRPKGMNFIWLYHVAPLFEDSISHERMIIDPSLADRPITVEKWVELQCPMQCTMKVAQANFYVTLKDRLLRAREFLDPKALPFEPVRQLSDVVPFRAKDIVASYRDMHHFIGEEKLAAVEQEAKRTRLLHATLRLVRALAQRQKIDTDLSAVEGDLLAVAASYQGIE